MRSTGVRGSPCRRTGNGIPADLPPNNTEASQGRDGNGGERDSFDLLEAEIAQLREEVARLSLSRDLKARGPDTPSAQELQRLHELHDRLAQVKEKGSSQCRNQTLRLESFPTLQDASSCPAPQCGPTSRRPSYADILSGQKGQTHSSAPSQQRSPERPAKQARTTMISPTKRSVPGRSEKTTVKVAADPVSPRKSTRPRSPVFATSKRPIDRQRRASLPASWVDEVSTGRPPVKSPGKLAKPNGNETLMSMKTTSSPGLSPSMQHGGFTQATLASKHRAIAAEHHGIPDRTSKQSASPTSSGKGGSSGQGATISTLRSSVESTIPHGESNSPLQSCARTKASAWTGITGKTSQGASQGPSTTDTLALQAGSLGVDLPRGLSSIMSRIPRPQGMLGKLKLRPALRLHVDTDLGLQPSASLYSANDVARSIDESREKETAQPRKENTKSSIQYAKVRGHSAEDLLWSHVNDGPTGVLDHQRKLTKWSHHSHDSVVSNAVGNASSDGASSVAASSRQSAAASSQRTVSEATLIRTSLRGDAPNFVPTQIKTPHGVHLQSGVQDSTEAFGTVPVHTPSATPDTYGLSTADIERYWPELEWIRLDPEEREVIREQRRLARYNKMMNSNNESTGSVTSQSAWSPLNHSTMKTDPQGNIIYPKTAWAARRAAKQVPTRLGRSSMPIPQNAMDKGWTIGSAQPGWWYGWRGGDGKEIAFTGYGPDAEKDPNSPVNFRAPTSCVPSPGDSATAVSGGSTLTGSQSSLGFSPINEGNRQMYGMGKEAIVPCGNYEISCAIEHIGLSGSVVGWCQTCRP
ncbi:hypothetical protein CAC42_1410 [Sphaceloma murrayae]|uniref:Uncharacterized protein n=1 Tax=Sphaceloma murrayae TaxID=2082308 RepID=A0A2K1QGA7_9PEZI|nr:hypothetical protein CAC42_1410 [Sphaceloma murrayae]